MCCFCYLSLPVLLNFLKHFLQLVHFSLYIYMYIHNMYIFCAYIYLYTYMPVYIYIYIFPPHLWPCEACRVLVPQPGLEPVVPAVNVCRLKHWITREVPLSLNFKPNKSGESLRSYCTFNDMPICSTCAQYGWIKSTTVILGVHHLQIKKVRIGGIRH